LVGAIAGLALLVAGFGDRVQLVEAADHADGIDAMSTMASDITDLYSWVWDDNGTPSLAMIINVDGPSFPDNIQYAWTLVRDPLPGASSTVAQMICQFNSTAGDDVSCFFGGSTDFVIAEGDPSGTGFTQNGIRVFAGERDDPFFFNSDGFSATASAVRTQVDGDGGNGELDANNIDANGCPDLVAEGPRGANEANLAAEVAGCLTTSCDQGFGAATADQTASTNGFTGTVRSIVVSVPLSMLPADADSDLVAVSGSTHVAP
jgi:hypothetical protein